MEKNLTEFNIVKVEEGKKETQNNEDVHMASENSH